MGLYDAIKSAPMPGGGNYFQAGKYLLEVTAFKNGMSADPSKGAYTVVEGVITEVLVDYQGSNKVGETVSWVARHIHGETTMSNIKGFVAAAADLDPDEIEGGDVEELVNTDTLAGVEVEVQATMITTKKGNPFTKVVWSSPS